MTQSKLEKITTAQLVQRFATIGVEQHKALFRREHGRFNRLFDEMTTIEEELKRRHGDQRRELLRLYEHPNPQVRLNAVKATLAVAPEHARRTLEAIAGSREYPQAGDAGMTIDSLEWGIFKPT
jgi:hypothetical protein